MNSPVKICDQPRRAEFSPTTSNVTFNTLNGSNLHRSGRKALRYLLLTGAASILCNVESPGTPVTLSHDQINELNEKLSHMRHEINNQLALVVAAVELARLRPDMRDKLIDTLGEQPPKITAEIARFSEEFETALGLADQ